MRRRRDADVNEIMKAWTCALSIDNPVDDRVPVHLALKV